VTYYTAMLSSPRSDRILSQLSTSAYPNGGGAGMPGDFGTPQGVSPMFVQFQIKKEDWATQVGTG